MSVSLKAMRYFNTAVARGSIAQAAEELNIAASAVSAAIDQVEETFGLELVTRQRSRGIMATASGRLMARKFERLLDDYHSVLTEGAELKLSLGGVLRVGYYAPVAPAFLPNLLASFVPKGSDAVFHLEECDNDAAQSGLLNGDFDVILFVSDGARAQIKFDTLVKAPPYCLLPEGHPLARQKTVRIAEIARQPLIVLDRPHVSAYYHQLFGRFEGDIRIVAYANSTEMVRSLVGEGLGCAILNMHPLTPTSYGGRDLVCRPLADDLPPLTLAIAYNRARPRRIVQHFVEACHAHFATQGPHRCIVEE